MNDMLDPWRKSLSHGIQSLSDVELLSLFLRQGNSYETSILLAKQLLDRQNGSLIGLMQWNKEEVIQLPHIGTLKAMQLMAIMEISQRISAAKYKKMVILTDPKSIALYYMEQYRHKTKEFLLVCFFNVKGHLLGEECVAVGSREEAVFSPGEIFKAAIMHSSSYLVLLHNHPSGNSQPSNADIQMTSKMFKMGQLLQIPLMDHIILGDNEFYSFNESGLLEQSKGVF